MDQSSREKDKNAAIIYFSPGKRTKKAAEEICVALDKSGYACTHYDISSCDTLEVSAAAYRDLDTFDLLVIGTPIYIDHISPPIKRFLENMPPGRRDAIIFATYGAVGSGLTLLNMAKILTGKGYRVIGAAKVVAQHTLTIFAKFPLGLVSPKDPNAPKLQSMVYYALQTCSDNKEAHVRHEILDYQTRFMHLLDHLIFNQKVFFAHFLPKVLFDPAKCTKCGECATVCAAGTITGVPLEFNDRDCFLCYECTLRCQGKALTVQLKDDFFLRVVSILNFPFERLVTRVFYPQ